MKSIRVRFPMPSIECDDPPFDGSIFLNGNNVRYHTLTINGTVYPVNLNYPFQQSWTLEEIDTAFQMNLDAVGDT
jgi:hypothetical protein